MTLEITVGVFIAACVGMVVGFFVGVIFAALMFTGEGPGERF